MRHKWIDRASRCAAAASGKTSVNSGGDDNIDAATRGQWRTRSSYRRFTTEGSASVEVSPRAARSTSFLPASAILRRMRRMVLADRVLGSAGAHCKYSGA